MPFPHPYWNVGWCGLVWASILSAVPGCSIVPQILEESLKLYRLHRLTLFPKSHLVMIIKTNNNMVKYGASSHYLFFNPLKHEVPSFLESFVETSGRATL